MLPRLRRGLLVLAIVALGVVPGDSTRDRAAAEEAGLSAVEELAIETAAGRHHFTVEMARTEAERARGLMYRERLAPEAGMLFVYERERLVYMWMKNTLIPLDMLFIAADGQIVRIAERTVPLSEEIIAAGRPARAVLEVNGGTAERLGIRVGDRVLHPIFAGP